MPRTILSLLVFALLAAAWLGCRGDVETRMAEVRALQDVGQYTESIEELRDILAVAPDLPEATYRLGLALINTGEPSRAIWALQRASESPDYAVPAGMLLANAQLSTGNFEEAIRAATRVLELDPERKAALHLRSRAYMSAGQHEESLKDIERLVELFPDDLGVRAFHATALADTGRIEEAEKAHELVKELGAATGDPAAAGRACLAPGLFQQLDREDMEKAERLYLECADKYPTDAAVIGHVMEFLDDVGKGDQATELIRRAAQEAPESLGLQARLANRLRSRGDPEAAERVMREAAESFQTARAWNLLVTFYRRQREPEKALEALERVIELGGGEDDMLRFNRADLLLDIGRDEEAEAVAAEIREPTYADLIRGRLLLTKGDPKQALEAFDKGIRAWPDNAGARYLAGLAALELGDFDRATQELREAVRVDNAATDASFVLARLYLDRGRYREAVQFATMAINARRGRDTEKLIVRARALTALERYEPARSALQRILQPEDAATQLVELARVDLAASGPEAAVRTLEASDADLRSEDYEQPLRLLVENLLALGRGEEAARRVEEALAERPDSAPLHELQGFVHARAGRDEEARAAYARAIELDPEYAGALGGLATLEANAGNLKAAIELFDRAAAAEPAEPSYAYAAAQLDRATGGSERVEARLREIVRRAPGHAASRNDLAWLLAERGKELDLALALAEEASRLDESPAMLDTLGWVRFKRGEYAAAVEALERAVEAQPESPSMRYRLGIALSQAGDAERAREMLQGALDAGTFPEAEAARRELAQLARP